MLCLPLVVAVLALSSTHAEIPNEYMKVFSCGRLHYRTMKLHDETAALYVGAMDVVYKMNSKNINESSCTTNLISLEAEDPKPCIERGGSEDYECRNHIRSIHPTHGRRMYVCGTNAENPRDWLLDENLVDLSSYVTSVGTGVGKCAFGPDDNVTSVWVERGNPGQLPGLYTGTVLDPKRTDRGIVRSELVDYQTMEKHHDPLRSPRFEPKWLDTPEFVASFAIGRYVYFFFREHAQEYANCGKAIFSRVARVCKQDLGAGKDNPNRLWGTLLKARLNCSIPGEFPFYFNEIHSVYLSDHEDMFFGVFSSPANGLFGSALCAFSVDEIDEVFSGTFMGQRNWDSAWLPVPWSKIPRPRPGTCVNDTLALPERMLLFHKTHPLMGAAASAVGNRPLHVEPGVVFNSILAHYKELVNGSSYLIYYAGSTDGLVYKIVQGKTADNVPFSYLADKWTITTEPIRKLEISREFEQLYVAYDSGITQIDLAICETGHSEADACLSDPYCKWTNGKCVPAPKKKEG